MDWLKSAGIYLIIVGIIIFLRSGLRIREKNFVELAIIEMIIRNHFMLMLILCALLLFGLFSGTLYWGVGVSLPLLAFFCFLPGLRKEYQSLRRQWERCRDEIVRAETLPVSVGTFLVRMEAESHERNLDAAALYMLFLPAPP